jgi:hypothetical protein
VRSFESISSKTYLCIASYLCQSQRWPNPCTTFLNISLIMATRKWQILTCYYSIGISANFSVQCEWHCLNALRKLCCWFHPLISRFQVRVITVFTVFRLLTDFVCLYNYEFGLSLCKIVRSSVILLLPLFPMLFSKS